MVKKRRSIKKTKKLIQRYFDFWIRWTGAGWYDIIFRYLENKKQLKESGMTWKYQNGFVSLMKCFPDWRYKQAFIHVNLVECAYQSLEKLENVVVHELMHIFLDELRSKKKGHEERVVTMLADGFIWVRDQTIRQEQAAHARRTDEE